MNELNKRSVSLVFKSAIGSILLGGMSMVFAASEPVALSGGEEVPPVTTSASGTVTIQVNPDKNVSGSVTTKGIDGTAAHIHEGEMGKNVSVAITLTKATDGKWTVPDGSKFTDAQYESYKAGKLYVNVHSTAHKDGEIRAQLKP